MAEERMTDDQILKQMGLTREQLKDALQKFNSFISTLDGAQRRAFLHSLRPAHEAARELDLHHDRLEEFLREVQPEGVIFVNCDVWGHKHS